MTSRAEGEGVRSLLIMCDSEGDLGDPESSERARAVENHRKWVEAAKTLGCHSVRVNARSNPDLPYEEQEKLAADGLRSLCELADPHGIGVLVENHGGLSSNGAWLSAVMKRVAHPRIGTLPDFGNFRLRETPEEWYDRYQGVAELMPFAHAVSAKSHDFDENGDEIHTDFMKMMRIVLDADYRGYVGIEYEGETLSEAQGVEKTKALLERVREELGRAYPSKSLI
jgi:sugar phosphate isomerase/epimerase